MASPVLLRLRRIAVAALLGAVVLPLVAAPGVDAAKSRYGVVVVHGDDSVSTQCIKLTSDKVKALELLDATDFDMYTTAFPGFGRGLCWLDGEGFATGADCFAPGGENWGIFLQKRGQDEPSRPSLGISGLNVPADSVLYAEFATDSGPPDFTQPLPPERSLKTICSPDE